MALAVLLLLLWRHALLGWGMLGAGALSILGVGILHMGFISLRKTQSSLFVCSFVSSPHSGTRKVQFVAPGLVSCMVADLP
jgi:hypothetical protein